MKLSVVIPCYNERATIAELLAAVRASPVPDLQIIVVDDGSTDGTRELLQDELRDAANVILLHESNLGKGAALRTGFAAATGDLVVIQDADREYNPDEYPKLMAPFLDNSRADVVYGSRFAGGQAHRVVYFWHMVGNRFLTLLSNMLTNLNLSDMETGFKMFRREVVQAVDLRESRFGFEPEITAKLARRGCVFYEVGISYHGRTYAEGKKIGWKDGVRACYCILRYSSLVAKVRSGPRA
jgi:glycosyltransferase involved in cell wall biosynthesis